MESFKPGTIPLVCDLSPLSDICYNKQYELSTKLQQWRSATQRTLNVAVDVNFILFFCVPTKRNERRAIVDVRATEQLLDSNVAV